MKARCSITETTADICNYAALVLAALLDQVLSSSGSVIMHYANVVSVLPH